MDDGEVENMLKRDRVVFDGRVRISRGSFAFHSPLQPAGLSVIALGIAYLALAATAYCREPHLKGRIPNHYEDAAVAKGEELGIGSAQLVGPRQVEVFSHQSWTFVYTAGKAGIKPGGGIRIGMRHLHCWTPPQTNDPKADGYMTASAGNGQPLSVRTQPPKELNGQYFAWQNLIEIGLPDKGLAPGETLAVVYGDRRSGSAGIRVQPFDESCFVFKTYVDAWGQGEYLPLGENPAIEIMAAQPYRLNVIMPSDAIVDQPTWCLVRVEDRHGNPAVSYRGTIRFQTHQRHVRAPRVVHLHRAGSRRPPLRIADLLARGLSDHSGQ